MDGPPLFPSLLPKLVDSNWFSVDKPCDDESDLTKLETSHKKWVIFLFSLPVSLCVRSSVMLV